MVILDLYRNPKFHESQAYRNTHSFWKFIRSTVEEGRACGVFRNDFETDYYMHLIQGAFEHEALAMMMLPKRKATLGRVEHMLGLLLRAI